MTKEIPISIYLLKGYTCKRNFSKKHKVYVSITTQIKRKKKTLWFFLLDIKKNGDFNQKKESN